jgi:hypothetical protein
VEPHPYEVPKIGENPRISFFKKGELVQKDVFILGDSRTGKTYWANEPGGGPIFQLQNKSCDRWPVEIAPSHLIWNEIRPLTEFNWQSLLDTADGYASISN